MITDDRTETVTCPHCGRSVTDLPAHLQRCVYTPEAKPTREQYADALLQSQTGGMSIYSMLQDEQQRGNRLSDLCKRLQSSLDFFVDYAGSSRPFSAEFRSELDKAVVLLEERVE